MPRNENEPLISNIELQAAKRIKLADSPDQPLTFLDLETRTLAQDWRDAFAKILESSWFKIMKAKLEAERLKGQVIYPPLEYLYNFSGCLLQSTKVVIIGQDPYHGPNQAHGLCFSVQRGVQIPRSLANIYKELQADIQDFKIPSHGCLEDWVPQGVVLLNATLTVRKGQANSHSSYGWSKFTDAIILKLNKSHDNIVFMLWGGFAQKKCNMIDSKRHLILKATHPSPLGANKGGWFGCEHFSKANAYLELKGKKPINWQV